MRTIFVLFWLIAPIACQIYNITVCEYLKQLIQCPDNSLIKILSSIYGRLNKQECSSSVVWPICYTSKNVSGIMKELCDRQNNCSIFYSSETFGGDPCPNIGKYTTVTYICYLNTFWAQWSDWSHCNNSYGYMNRTRNCTVLEGFDQCFGNSTEEKKCYATWIQWGDWSRCDVTYEVMNRTRKCNVSNSNDWCDGNNYEIKKCFATWLLWSDWSPCNSSYGFMNRARECNISNPFDWCNGNNSEVKICFVFWTTWSQWSNCNSSYGFMNRTRECISSNSIEKCYGNNSEVKECYVFWTTWSQWSRCNSFYGFMNRTRECISSKSIERCYGNNSEVKKCYVFWAQWSSWTSCNGSIGFIKRVRDCNTSSTIDQCLGSNSEVSECFAFWAQWSSWSPCNDSQQLMNRTRQCNNLNSIEWCYGESFEEMQCVEKWASWSECSVTCGPGIRRRYSLQVITAHLLQVEDCNLINCPVDGMWGLWRTSGCSKRCGSGVQILKRNCDSPSPSSYGRDCMGVSNYTEFCDTDTICPINGNWSMWSPWSLCSKACEGGTVSRFRSCSNPIPKIGGQDCDGSITEFNECPKQTCKSVMLNMTVNFVDIEFIESYTSAISAPFLALRNKIQVAVDKLYRSYKVNFVFNVVVHSTESRP